MKEGKFTVFAEALFDGAKLLKNVAIEVKDSKIVDVSKSSGKGAKFKGVVTPAFIDAHSHIGMFRQGEPGSEQEGNDFTDQIKPLNDPLNSIYMDDYAFNEAITFGVLYSCIMPGSGNLFGGRSRIIRHNASHVGEALFKDYGYKMALGFNPRATTDWKGERPNTRMGIYAMLERRFNDVIAKSEKSEISYQRKCRELEAKRSKKEISKEIYNSELKSIEREKELDLTPEEKALFEAATGKKVVKVHVHKEDDVIYLIELVKRFGMNVTAEHTGDVYHQEIFEMLAKAGIPIIFGPLGGHAYKIELQHAYYTNAGLLMKSGAKFGLMTDHPVIQVTGLRESLKFFLIAGMSEVDAIGLITKQNAEILKIDDKVGSIKPGKLASLLVWDGHPLHLASFPRTVIGEGQILRQP